MRRLLWLLPALALAAPAGAQEDYGAKGIFPVYEKDGQWLVFDKGLKRTPLLGLHNRFLVIGSEGAEVFEVARASQTYGALCKERKPAKLRAGLLKGPRRLVGRPIIGIHVPASFSLKGSRAAYAALKNQVGENTYRALEGALKETALADVRASSFPFKSDDEGASDFTRNPKPERIYTKIDFASPMGLKAVPNAFVLVEETQISSSHRRCLRLAAADKLLGGCVAMPRALMAETALLDFVSYDPAGSGSPYLLAFTRAQPLWGDERWGFIVRESGPRLFLMDTMDVRCRDSF